MHLFFMHKIPIIYTLYKYKKHTYLIFNAYKITILCLQNMFFVVQMMYNYFGFPNVEGVQERLWENQFYLLMKKVVSERHHYALT
jgi:hypothetical protein